MKEVLFRVDYEDEWEHLIIINESGSVISDAMENHSLSALDVLKELAKYNIIKLVVEEIK